MNVMLTARRDKVPKRLIARFVFFKQTRKTKQDRLRSELYSCCSDEYLYDDDKQRKEQTSFGDGFCLSLVCL